VRHPSLSWCIDGEHRGNLGRERPYSIPIVLPHATSKPFRVGIAAGSTRIGVMACWRETLVTLVTLCKVCRSGECKGAVRAARGTGGQVVAAEDRGCCDAGWAHACRLPSGFGLSRYEGWCIIARQQWFGGCWRKRAVSVMGGRGRRWRSGNRISKVLV